MTTPITTPTELDPPDPSPTVLALAQALAERDGQGAGFTSQTKTESAARIASEYIREAKRIAAHLPAAAVKPGRDAAYQAWHGTDEPWGGCADSDAINRVLAILPGKTEQEVRAGALRDAQQVIAGEDSIAWARTASGSHIMLDHAIGMIDDLIADEEAGK